MLLTLCFAPWNQPWLCWIALTPLLCAVWFGDEGARPWKRHALLGYVAGFVFFSGTFYWLSALGTLFQQPWLHGLPPLLALYLGLYLAFWAWFVGRFPPIAKSRTESVTTPPEAEVRVSFAPKNARATKPPTPFSSRRHLMISAVAACAWVSHEWVRGWLFSGFGWNGLGVALHDDLAMIQIVDITGVAGLSFLVAFCNVMIVLVVRRIVGELGPVFLKRIRWEFSFTAALVVIVFAYGVRQLLRAPQPGESVRIAAVQPNIAQAEKFSGENEDRVLAQLGDLTGLAATTSPHLLLWPEAATPRGMFADETNYRFTLEQAGRGDFAMLIGTVAGDADLNEDYNIAALITERGGKLQAYRKMHLVPFGEYMPLRHSFPLFAWVAGELVPADFAPGREFTVMPLPKPDVKISPLICFEDTLGDLTRRFVLNGSQLLVNLTNDGWFLETAGAEQHLANAVFRAVENRRPLVRCANTGVTCSVSARGHVDRWLAPFQRGFASREISVEKAAPLTFYTRHGDWLAIGSVLVTSLTLAAAAFRRARR